MIVVIIAGGSGTRLWPLSTPDYPKHLLKVDGDDLSLLQHTYRRARQLTDQVYVISEIGHIQHVKAQLAELPESAFIVEPARRGTASCIVAALVEISKTKPGNEPIAFLAADHHIRDTDGFVHSFQVAAESVQKYNRLVLVGVEPDYPATGFGYVQKDKLMDKDLFVFSVRSFKEKPDYDTAVQYLASGQYLWNCSYFLGSLDIFMTAMRAHAPQLLANYQNLQKASAAKYVDVYLGFENISIDYALIEKMPDLLVVPASFDWMDLGSFGDLHKAVGGDKQGNHVYGRVELEQVENSLVRNYDNKPLAVIGLNNVAVINTPAGMLVTRKDLAQKVGDISKRFQGK